jgi:hypothetical protein
MKPILVAAMLLSVSTAFGQQNRCTFTAPTEAKVTKMHVSVAQQHAQYGDKMTMIYVFETSTCSIGTSKQFDPMAEKFDININDVLIIKKFKNGHFEAYKPDGKRHRSMDVISAE